MEPNLAAKALAVGIAYGLPLSARKRTHAARNPARRFAGCAFGNERSRGDRLHAGWTRCVLERRRGKALWIHPERNDGGESSAAYADLRSRRVGNPAGAGTQRRIASRGADRAAAQRRDASARHDAIPAVARIPRRGGWPRGNREAPRMAGKRSAAGTAASHADAASAGNCVDLRPEPANHLSLGRGNPGIKDSPGGSRGAERLRTVGVGEPGCFTAERTL